MNTGTVQALLHLNRQFYQTFALQFSADRQRLQPGVRRILENLPGEGRFLDLGCGNGELARALRLRGQLGLYVGLDFSLDLIKIAQARNRDTPPGSNFKCLFLHSDLADPDWAALLQSKSLSPNLYPLIPFDFIVAFAVLHHLPGKDLRLQVLRSARELLASHGRLIHSHWQLLNSARLRARIQPWERIGLAEDDVDPGDYIIDWRHGGYGLRYVHHFSTPELADLAAETGFSVIETFLSDGEGGQLGLYQTWEKPPG